MSFIVDAFNQVAQQRYLSAFEKQHTLTLAHVRSVKQSGCPHRKQAALQLIRSLKTLYSTPEPTVPRWEEVPPTVVMAPEQI